MYDFPPHPSTLWANVIGAIVVWVGTGIMFWMLRRKCELRVFDASIFLGIAIGQTYCLIQDYGTPYRMMYPHFSFLVIAWTGMIVATIANWVRLENQDRPYGSGAAISSGWWLGCLVILALIFTLKPVVGGRTAGRRTQCKNNLKQIGLALHNYHDTYETFPAAFAGKPRQSWRVNILPFIDQAPLYNEYDFNSKWNEGANVELSQLELAAYQCPSDPYHPKEARYPFTAYAAIIDSNSIWPGEEAIHMSKVPDGSSNTLLAVEACGQRIPWAEPRDVKLSETTFGMNLPGRERHHSDGLMSSYHTGGVQVLLADGSVHFLSENIDPEVISSLITRNGGEDVGDF